MRIAARLSAIDPDSSGIYGSHASEYNAQLDDLHAWTEEQVGLISEDNRLFVTSHDSFGYFALLYGFNVVGVILGTTTETEPSAEDLTELIQEIEEYGVSSVFGETTVSERLAETVATETGAQLVRLYSGSLGGDGQRRGDLHRYVQDQRRAHSRGSEVMTLSVPMRSRPLDVRLIPGLFFAGTPVGQKELEDGKFRQTWNA